MDHQKNEKERGIYRIAKLQNVTPRWVRDLRKINRNSEYPYPNRPGGKPSSYIRMRREELH